jgi:hypothetical protein
MRRCGWLGGIVVVLAAFGRGHAGEPQCCPPPADSFLQRLHPVGGWCPDGGGLLRWWPCHCFPRGGAPDDYCRKPPPKVCWPPYNSCFIFGPPEVCYPACPGPHGVRP